MTLATIPLKSLSRKHSIALARLTLWTYSRIHALLLPVQTWLGDTVRKSADVDGNARLLALADINRDFEGRWQTATREYVRLLERSRTEAGSLPFGVLLVQHNRLLDGLRRPVTEAAPPPETDVIERLWVQRRQAALRAAQERVRGDGLMLNQRIWRLENEGLNQIRAELAHAMTERTNALALARRLEDRLGADARKTRWEPERLREMTPKQRAQSKQWLLRGNEQPDKGIAYNAIRLARTELQFANHAVATEIAKHNPAVTGRKVRLSPGHPKSDICDELAAGGPYEKSKELIPAHPACMCRYEDVLMDKATYQAQVQGWLRGDNDFLDDYSTWLTGRYAADVLPWEMPLAEKLEMWLSAGIDPESVGMDVKAALAAGR